MMKRRMTFTCFLVGIGMVFLASSGAHASGGLENPWGIDYSNPKGTNWEGTIFMTAEIADVPGLPAGLPEYAAPAGVPGYNDRVVKIGFFIKLENKKLGFVTFSGLAFDFDGFYLFYALGDYASGRIGEALNKFLEERVYPRLPGGPYAGGSLTGMEESSGNVEFQLQEGRGLRAETPLYYSAKITVVAY